MLMFDFKCSIEKTEQMKSSNIKQTNGKIERKAYKVVGIELAEMKSNQATRSICQRTKMHKWCLIERRTTG